MAPNFAEVIGQFKADVGRALSPRSIERACADLDHVFRNRILDPVTTIYAFLTQVLHGNTACTELPHLTGKRFSAAAYVDARSRLPLVLFDRLVERVTESFYSEQQASGLWHDHRTWHLDGSSFPMADCPELQKTFGQPGNQK